MKFAPRTYSPGGELSLVPSMLLPLFLLPSGKPAGRFRLPLLPAEDFSLRPGGLPLGLEGLLGLGAHALPGVVAGAVLAPPLPALVRQGRAEPETMEPADNQIVDLKIPWLGAE